MTLPATDDVKRVTLRRNEKCPTCKRPFAYLREGTYLPPAKARMFDLIRDRPGISSHELATLLYERDDADARNSVRVHINQLRSLLLGTECKIKSGTSLGYWLEMERTDVGT